MKIERHIAGWFTAPAGVMRRDEPLDEHVRLPVPVYVIETETERILVDTGLHPAAVEDSERHYGRPGATGPFTLEQEHSIADLVDLTTITKVVMTHLHFDHAGALSLLPDHVPVVLQRREWEAAHDDEAIARNFLQPRDYAELDGRVTLVDGDHDLLGDGSIRLLLTPGHTPGHQSVKIGDDLVIAADVFLYSGGLDDKRFPVFADSHTDQSASADRLRALRDAGATVIPGHDPALITPGPVAS